MGLFSFCDHEWEYLKTEYVGLFKGKSRTYHKCSKCNKTEVWVVFRNLCHFSIIKKTGVTHDSIFRLQQSIS